MGCCIILTEMESTTQPPGDFSHQRKFSFGDSIAWAFVTALGWGLYVLAQGILAVATFGTTLYCITLATPLLAFLLGGAQHLLLRETQYKKLAGSWAARSALGWGVGMIVAHVLIISQSLVLARQGRTIPVGDPLDLGFFLAALMLTGAIVGVAQWWSEGWWITRTDARETIRWAAVNIVAWGAGGIVLWAALKLYVIEGYQPICVDCVTRVLLALLLGGIALGVITGLALWSRVSAIISTVAIVAVCIVMVQEQARISATPLFEATRKGPTKTLVDYSTVPAPDIAFSPDGNLLVACGSTGEGSGTLNVWSTSDWQQIRALQINASPRAVAFSPDGEHVGVQAETGRYILFKADNWAEEEALWTGVFRSSTTALSMDQSIYAEAWGKVITIKRNSIEVLSLQTEFEATALALTPAGENVAAFWGQRGKIWRVIDGEELFTLDASDDYSGPIYNLEISPDGRTLASASRYGKVEIWKLDP
jgi:hypothetical protein